MKLKIEPKITKDYLLERNSQETYMEYYLGIKVKKGLFKSPLRKDNKPTCSFMVAKNGDIVFKDFSGAFFGNFIDVVKFKFNCDYYKAINIIANDFGYIERKELPKNPTPKISETKFESTGFSEIQVEIQDFTERDIEYWNQFNVNIDILKKFNVYSCKTVFLNGTIHSFYSERIPSYGYYRGTNSENNQLWRIYYPTKRIFRFISNWNSNMIQGTQQLPRNGDLLVITKSLKDVMCLYSFGISAIAPCSENLFMEEDMFSTLKNRFKNIVLFYDNDLPGIHNMNKIRKKFRIDCIWIPRSKKSKDISDFCKLYGVQTTKKFIDDKLQTKDNNASKAA